MLIEKIIESELRRVGPNSCACTTKLVNFMSKQKNLFGKIFEWIIILFTAKI